MVYIALRRGSYQMCYASRQIRYFMQKNSITNTTANVTIHNE